MKTSVKQKNNRSIPPTSERHHHEESIRSKAIRVRARDILNSMPKELKDLCDELAKF